MERVFCFALHRRYSQRTFLRSHWVCVSTCELAGLAVTRESALGIRGSKESLRRRQLWQELRLHSDGVRRHLHLQIKACILAELQGRIILLNGHFTISMLSSLRVVSLARTISSFGTRKIYCTHSVLNTIYRCGRRLSEVDRGDLKRLVKVIISRDVISCVTAQKIVQSTSKVPHV